MEQFDVIVIGGGAAGENVAGRCGECGASIAVVESALVGGECSYWACMPSKTLLRPGEVLAEVRRVPGAAEAVTGSVDAGAVLSRRNEIVDDWDDDGQVQWLDRAGAVLLRGHGRLVGERRVDVSMNDGTRRELEATRRVVIATGSRAEIPPIDGLRDIRVWESRDADLGEARTGTPGRARWRFCGLRARTGLEAPRDPRGDRDRGGGSARCRPRALCGRAAARRVRGRGHRGDAEPRGRPCGALRRRRAGHGGAR